ncbi:THUMP domain-containing protein [Methanosphaera sp. ISO3-F5]|uniref:DNA methyltransferase n=1 Tax=Methanosphaera sp. ISO3-F5 TaxID=1452353 RepID=UPI002B25BC25|nr:THUMP domain-containing protein [Methanosphaera sp. ISO3-F5]WQH64327.1 THUMP domain-containing protein [Methanosphaera sp. ISO3-F5]
MEITVILSQENETLPRAELLARLETLEIPYEIQNEYPGVIELDVDADKQKITELGAHLGYTHEILTTIDKTTPEKLTETIENIPWDKIIKDSFKVRVKRMGNGEVDKDKIERSIGGYIQDKCQMPVSLDNAVHTIKLVYTNPKTKTNQYKEEKVIGYNKIIITELLIQQDKKHFFDNKPHKRPYFHPGSMSPKLALCMVNLAHTRKGDTVLDPFCGTGGILIEAGDLNTTLIASDLERCMYEGTKLNLAHEGFKNYKVYWEDVRKLEIEETVDAVAMDPPYGISTTLGGEDTKKLYTEALNAIEKHLKQDGYICMASPHYINMQEVVENTPLTIKEQHSIRMHKSLTRIITVLTKK